MSNSYARAAGSSSIDPTVPGLFAAQRGKTADHGLCDRLRAPSGDRPAHAMGQLPSIRPRLTSAGFSSAMIEWLAMPANTARARSRGIASGQPAGRQDGAKPETGE